MKRFRVTMMVPQDSIIEAVNTQAAHNYVTKMMESNKFNSPPVPTLWGIEEVVEDEPDYSGFDPVA